MTRDRGEAERPKIPPRLAGVYAIRNTVSGHVYIGSSYRIAQRFYSHKSGLRQKTHPIAALQKSWDEYGEKVFVFEVIEAVESADFFPEREQHWIDALHAAEPETGFNRSPKSSGGHHALRLRVERIMFLVDKDDRAAMEEAAAREGQTLSAWLRLVALRAARLIERQ